MKPLYNHGTPMNVAIFMSGSGTNAKKIIEAYIDDRRSGSVVFEPVLIFSDNPDSNAERIGRQDYASQGVVLDVVCDPIRKCIKDLKSMESREIYDFVHLVLCDEHDVDCVALAGYDWIVTSEICDKFLTVNVHPGDLRVRKPNGRPAYAGLGWEPSAKAVLAGENNVYTSVHVVTPVLDGGPILDLSDPVPVPESVRSLEDRAVLLGMAESVKQISEFIRASPDTCHEELCKLFPIYGIAKDLQEELKGKGDWVVFPRTLRRLAEDRYSIDDAGKAYLDCEPVWR